MTETAYRMTRPDMYCPQCGSALPQGATYCTQCAAVVDPVDHVIKTVTRVTKDALTATGQALDRAAKAVEPTVDRTVKAIGPAAGKVVQVTKEAADKTAKAVSPTVEKVAGATERAARNLKEKAQRKKTG